jgi:hypothetical protein
LHFPKQGTHEISQQRNPLLLHVVFTTFYFLFGTQQEREGEGEEEKNWFGEFK